LIEFIVKPYNTPNLFMHQSHSKRIHSSNNGHSPMEFEHLYRCKKNTLLIIFHLSVFDW
jgi:hypothetical protein